MPEPGSSATRPPRTRRFGSLRARLALGLGVALTALIGIELVARVAYTFVQDFKGKDEWYRLDPVIGWERKPGFRGEIFGVFREFDAEGIDVADRVDLAIEPERLRVVTVGDSRTFGFGVARWENWCTRLRELVPQINVINLGVHGYTSYQGREIMQRQAWQLKPDLITICFDFNDRRALRPDELPDSAERFTEVQQLSTLRSRLARSYAMRAVARMFGKPLANFEAGSDPSWHQQRYDVRELKPRVSVEQYRENLRAMIAAAREHGVPVLLIVMRDSPVYATVPEVKAAQMRTLLAEGKAAEAEALLVTSNDNPDNLRLRRELVRIYEELGRAEDADRIAKDATFAPSLHGGTPLLSQRPYIEALQQVAQETQTPWIDASTELMKMPKLFFTDECHFNNYGNQLVAEAIAPSLRQVLGLNASDATTSPTTTLPELDSKFPATETIPAA